MGWKGVGLPPRSHFDSAQHERPHHAGDHPHPSPLPSRERGLDTSPQPLRLGYAKVSLRRNDGRRAEMTGYREGGVGVRGGWRPAALFVVHTATDYVYAVILAVVH